MKKIILLVLAIASFSTAVNAARPEPVVGDDGTTDKGAVINGDYKGPNKDR